MVSKSNGTDVRKDGSKPAHRGDPKSENPESQRSKTFFNSSRQEPKRTDRRLRTACPNNCGVEILARSYFVTLHGEVDADDLHEVPPSMDSEYVGTVSR